MKPASVLHNSSLILGKQIIHILPEGWVLSNIYLSALLDDILMIYRSAMLNPNQTAYCIDAFTTSVNLPVQINQTNPILIEVLRIDLDTNTNETLTISAKEIRKLKKQAEKQLINRDPASPRYLQYPVKRTGLYHLQKVVDESKLEVQRRLSDTLVVRCPSAHVRSVPKTKCIGDLSDFYLQVDATPPIQIKYSKSVNNHGSGHAVLTIPAKSPTSPLTKQRASGALISRDPTAAIDVSWARTQSTQISVNESFASSGNWWYSIDEVQDGCGNLLDYANRRLLGSHHRHGSTELPLDQSFLVHERPRVALQGCNSQHVLQVPKGDSIRLPLRISSTGANDADQGPLRLSYLYTPAGHLSSDQEHLGNATLTEFQAGSQAGDHSIHEPGLYALQTVESAFCAGEILEPSSCLLSNPPEPEVSIESQNIPDRCAGNSIGLLVNLDLIGTPPFRLSYIIRHHSGSVTPKIVASDLLHTQLELRPSHSGHYTYEFLDISDAVYREPRSLRDQGLNLEQDVKPPASARFLDPYPTRKTCIGEPVNLGVQFSGEAPWRLDYELIHNGRRQKHTLTKVDANIVTLATDALSDGGEYSLALTAVTDSTECKVSLKQETKIEVALQRPKASFGLIEGQRSILALEDKKVKLPLRLQGEAPWMIKYRNLDDEGDGSVESLLRNSNDEIEVGEAGTYELVGINDATCPGNVDAASNKFKLGWIPRPKVHISESSTIEFLQGKYVKKDICEGDEDAVEVSFTGTPPFNVEYGHWIKSERGSQSTANKKLTAGTNIASVRMESTEAGIHQYKVSKVSDLSYNHNPHKFSPVTVEQRVHARPSAVFIEGGKTYKYCKEEDSGGENVPIALKGLPPFHLEIEVRHHASSKPELVTIPNVETYRYDLHISHRLLSLGTHAVLIRKVRDANGCQQQIDQEAPRVQVNVAEVPSIRALEAQTDYCVGDRISYMLSGSPPFNVFYTFHGQERKASAPTTNFRRLAEKPGEFIITAMTDQRSIDCKAHTQITKVIHEMPSVRVSKGRTATVDIHEGGEAEILFEFGGTPPFEFTRVFPLTTLRAEANMCLDTHVVRTHQKARGLRSWIPEVTSPMDSARLFRHPTRVSTRLWRSRTGSAPFRRKKCMQDQEDRSY